jgi:heme/copper-type cytochrome/quinol oxidase subunit 1
VLIGGAVFPLFGALHYWFPKMTGRMASERLGKIGFWLLFVGFNLTFFPMHQLGLHGMTRRIYTYLPGLGWDTLNFTATIGAALMAAAVLTMTVNVIRSLRGGAAAPSNPWNASKEPRRLRIRGTRRRSSGRPHRHRARITFIRSQWSPPATRCGMTPKTCLWSWASAAIARKSW